MKYCLCTLFLKIFHECHYGTVYLKFWFYKLLIQIQLLFASVLHSGCSTNFCKIHGITPADWILTIKLFSLFIKYFLENDFFLGFNETLPIFSKQLQNFSYYSFTHDHIHRSQTAISWLTKQIKTTPNQPLRGVLRNKLSKKCWNISREISVVQSRFIRP